MEDFRMNEMAEGDEAYFEYLEAREAAIQAAIGSFMMGNVPSSSIRTIYERTSNECIKLAASICLYQRGEEV